MKLQGFLLFLFVLLICKSMETCYRIEYFNYLLVSLLFGVDILIYFIFKKYGHLLIQLRNKLLFSLPLMGFLLYSQRAIISGSFQSYFIDNFHLINHSIYTTSTVDFDAFFPFFLILLPLVTAVATAYAEAGRSEITIGIFFTFMLSFWNNGFDRMLSSYFFFFMLLSILFFAINRLERLTIKHRNTGIQVSIDRKKIVYYGIAMALFIALTAMSFIHIWGNKSIFQLKSDYDANKERIMKYAMDTAYGLSLSGYRTNEKKLGGPIALDNGVAFRVMSNSPLYLRGSTKDYYDGFVWHQTPDTYMELRKNSPINLSSEFIRFMLRDPAAAFAGSSPRQQLQTNKAVIYPEALITSTFLAPNNTYDINAKRGKVLFNSKHNFILLEKKTPMASYSIQYYESQIGAELFSNLYDLPISIPYETDSSDPFKRKYYDEAVSAPYAKYLQLPDNLTERTYSLVHAIVRDCKTTKEKVEKIERYLSAHFPYSLDVSRVPGKHEFIDYFLFTEQKGYCTYFATTATIFCRIAGIPARYVEGFHMGDKKDQKGNYIVTNDCAHAWTEALLSPESGLWSIVDSVPAGAASLAIPGPTPYRDKFSGDYYENGLVYESENTGEGGFLKASNLLKRAMDTLLYPLVAIPLLTAFLAAVTILYRLYRIKLIKKYFLEHQSLIPLYRYTAARLETIKLGLPFSSCELDNAKSISDTVLREAVEKLVKACYREHYGSFEPEPFDRTGFYRLIEASLYKHQHFFYYWYFRLVSSLKNRS